MGVLKKYKPKQKNVIKLERYLKNKKPKVNG